MVVDPSMLIFLRGHAQMGQVKEEPHEQNLRYMALSFQIGFRFNDHISNK